MLWTSRKIRVTILYPAWSTQQPTSNVFWTVFGRYFKLQKCRPDFYIPSPFARKLDRTHQRTILPNGYLSTHNYTHPEVDDCCTSTLLSMTDPSAPAKACRKIITDNVLELCCSLFCPICNLIGVVARKLDIVRAAEDAARKAVRDTCRRPSFASALQSSGSSSCRM